VFKREKRIVIRISIEKFAELFFKDNTGEKYKDVVKEIKRYIETKKTREPVVKYVDNQHGQSEVQLTVLMDVLPALPVKAMILVIMKYIKNSN